MSNKYVFNAKDATEKVTTWLKEWFEINGKDCNAIIGISGGKDSSIAAALCVKALGADRVIGVLMPQGDQLDIDFSIELCKTLGIRSHTINIKEVIDKIYNAVGNSFEISEASKVNLPPRIRMSILYLVGASHNGRVINTCNLSENWIGYSTRYGDDVGDVGPLSNFTVEEVIAIGKELGLPDKFTTKIPLDGLCDKTDEDNLGFTYQTLDNYIRRGIEPEPKTKERIDYLHRVNQFKLRRFDTYKYFED
ncbi:MAG: NAD(+) synthase [Ruminococcaceae bacterium]|nr:NAD(+) synthase [Oscillospiraceae bacterium]